MLPLSDESTSGAVCHRVALTNFDGGAKVTDRPTGGWHSLGTDMCIDLIIDVCGSGSLPL